MINHFYLILKKKPNWITSMKSLTLRVTLPGFLGMSPESKIQTDELAREYMGNHKWNSVKMPTALSGTYLHCSSQICRKKNPLTSPWNFPLLKEIPWGIPLFRGRFSLKGSYGSRHPCYQGIWKQIMYFFPVSELWD